MKNPCFGCLKRTVTCHVVCSEYQHWSEENEKIKEQKRQESDGRQLSDGLIRKYWRNLKRGRSIANR